MELDGFYGKVRFSTSCTVNVAYSFASGMGDGSLLFCFCVVRCDHCFLLDFHSLWAEAPCSSMLLSAVRTCDGQLFVILALVGVMSSFAISAGLDFRPVCLVMVAELSQRSSC